MEDLKFLKLAIKLSRKGIGYTKSNPMVGAVVVKNGKILSTGFHKKFGDKHAERVALEKTDEKGTTLYVSLEPCCHFGKTPPCTDFIIEKKVKKVVIGSIDPNPLVGKKGIKKLKDSGIEVVIGTLDYMNREINSHYFINMEKGRPFISLRAGISIDGKLTDKFRNSRWMTNKQLRDISHDLRGEYSSILTGINTVFDDNPKLNLRTERWKDKELIRIILDTNNRIRNFSNSELNVLNDQDLYPTYIFSSKSTPNEPKNDFHFFVNETEEGLDLTEILDILYKKGVSSILVEGGGKIISSFLCKNLYDEIILFSDKKIIGGKESVELFDIGTDLKNPIVFSNSAITEFNSGYIFRGTR